MAKGNGKTPTNGNGQEKPQPAYFKSLTIEDVKCFKGKHTIDLSDGNGKPAQWTVILGNNNTGKTTILKCLAGLDTVETSDVFVNFTPGESYIVPAFFAIDSGSLRDFGNLIFDADGILNAKILIASFGEKGEVQEIQWGFTKEKKYRDGKVGIEINAWNKAIECNLQIYSYGAVRRMATKAISENQPNPLHLNLFEHGDLPNMEDWLLNLFLAEKLGRSEARPVLDLAKKVLASGLLPDVQEVNLNSREKDIGFVNFAEFLTDFGWIRLHDLGFGYQTMIAWVLDLVKRMVERYPHSLNPLAEPAIVLVDEIDLHLHPDWQRKIIAHLTQHFPSTQFIVTAHSPLVVQSAEEVNIVILKKEGESVHIEQPKIRSFRGWTVEEILTDLMDLAGQTMSQEYLDLMDQFNDALQDDDLEKAEAAYRGLDKILHPDSSGRTLLKLQMSSLSPAFAL